MNGHFLAITALRSAIWLVILAAIFVPLERLFPLHRQKVFRKQFWTDLGYYFLNGAVLAFVLGPPVAAIAFAAHSLTPHVLLSATAAWPLWVRACGALIVGEIGYYWVHRLCHEVPFLWRFHAVHHSAEHVDFLVSSRAHPVDIALTRIGALAPLYVLGLVSPIRATDGLIPILFLLTGSIWGYFIHANMRCRLGPVEWLVATPKFHHWHHTYGGKVRDCNYASMLPWVDRIFATHYLPRDWPGRYGIDEPMAETLAGQLAQPFQTHPVMLPAKPDAATANWDGGLPRRQ